MRLFISVFVLIATLCGHSNAAAQNADSVEEICGIGRNNEAKDFSKARLEECLRLKGHDLFKNGNAFVRPDFSCDSAVPGLRAASHRASNEYCLKVADAHEAIYKFRPYWAFCGEPETVSDKNLQACVRGFFRFNELWQRPSHPRYSTESNCNSALAVYGNAFTDGHIQFDGKQQEKWRVRNAITCDRMRTAIASIVQFESARCYASELFYSDQIAFFQKCMGDAIDADVTCREIQSQYVDRLITDNGGIPHNRNGSQGRIPTCDAILAIRAEPFAAEHKANENPEDVENIDTSDFSNGTNKSQNSKNEIADRNGNSLGLITLSIIFIAIVGAVFLSGAGGKPSPIVEGTTLGRLASTDDLFLIINKQRTKSAFYKPFSIRIFEVIGLFIGLVVGYFFLSLVTYLWALLYFRVPIIGSVLLFLSALGVVILLFSFLIVAISKSHRSSELQKQIIHIAGLPKTSEALLALTSRDIGIVRTIGARSYMGKYLTRVTSLVLVGTLQLLTIAIFANNNAIFDFVGWTNSVFIDTITFGIIPPFGPFQPDAENLSFVGKGLQVGELNFQIYTALYKFLLVAFTIPVVVMNARNRLSGEYRYRGNIFGLSAQLAGPLADADFDKKILIARIRDGEEVNRLSKEKIINELIETSEGIGNDTNHQNFKEITKQVTKKLSSKSAIVRSPFV